MNGMSELELKMKVCLLGDPAVGKTSLIRKFVLDSFDDKYISTLGSKVTKKSLSFNVSDRAIRLSMMIWDALGQAEFKNVLQGAFKGAKGALLVCDLTRKETLEDLETWIEELFGVAGPLPVVMIANKCDLEDEYDFSEEDLKQMAGTYGCPCYITSAKTGDHVEDAFQTIAREMALIHLKKKEVKIPPELTEGEDIPVSAGAAADDINTIIDVEDYIIARFCEVMGGQEFAMPIIRQQFRKNEMDFKDPELEKLEKVTEGLVNVTTNFKNEEEARDLGMDLRKAIQQYRGKGGRGKEL